MHYSSSAGLVCCVQEESFLGLVVKLGFVQRCILISIICRRSFCAFRRRSVVTWYHVR